MLYESMEITCHFIIYLFVCLLNDARKLLFTEYKGQLSSRSIIFIISSDHINSEKILPFVQQFIASE
jgi:hypothetical protein